VSSHVKMAVISLNGCLVMSVAWLAVRSEACKTAGRLTRASTASELTLFEAEGLEMATLTNGVAAETQGVANSVKAIRFVRLLRTVGKVFIGIGVVLFFGTIAFEIAEGQDDRKKLVRNIHALQPNRLIIAYLKQEAENVMSQLARFEDYLQFKVDGDEEMANNIAEHFSKAISDDNSHIKWSELEDALEARDRASNNFYGDDDLKASEVVACAEAIEARLEDAARAGQPILNASLKD